MRFYITILTLLLTCFTTAFSQTLSDRAQISLLTCGPGNELYSVYGHTAIRVHDPATFTDVVYNYGTFDFDTPNFYLKFVKGDMMYMLSADSYQDFIYTYRYYNRDVYEQVLNLTPVQKQQFATQLNQDIQSDKRFYQYKFIDRNCTTVAAEKTQAVLGTALALNIKDRDLTYREILYTYQKNHFFENLGINLIFGAKTDRNSDTVFLPLELMESIEKTTINGKPLTNATTTVYKSTGITAKTPLLNNCYTFLIIALVITYFSGRRAVYVPLLLLLGLTGIFFTLAGLYSFHNEISYNYNALLINPLFLVLLYFTVVNNATWIKRLACICLGCLLLYIILMLNKPHLLIVSPLLLLIAVMLIRFVKVTTAVRQPA